MYNKKEWVSKEVITKEALNNIENGIADLDERLENLDMSDKQDKTDNNLVTESKDIVGAINELFQSANNGKEIIADAIGEPLNAEDTFAAMGNDINGLLATFKTNMMNSGVVVESTDKFKSLIDKIKGLIEGEGNKGVQFASGSIDNVEYNSQIEIDSLNFKPSLVYTYAYIPESYEIREQIYLQLHDDSIFNVCGYANSSTPNNRSYCYINGSLFDNGFRISSNHGAGYPTYYWYAIGVGEEDTTLRDSLASILEEEGVEVSEEDDMASLISKVDNEFDRKNEEITAKEEELANSGGGLDIISVTELPATGKENQICVITDNPTNKFIISSDELDALTDTGLIYIITSLSAFGVNVNLSNNNNITQCLYIDRITQNNITLRSFIYTNGDWVEITTNYVYIILNNKVQTNEFGGLQTTGGKVTHSSANGYTFSMTGAGANVYVATTSKNTVDFSKYSTVVIKLKTSPDITDRGIGIYLASTADSGTQSTTQKASQIISVAESTDIYYEYRFNITSWTTTGYFGIEASAKFSSYIYISDIYFI